MDRLQGENSNTFINQSQGGRNAKNDATKILGG